MFIDVKRCENVSCYKIGVKPRVPDVTKEESSEKKEDDEEEMKDEFVITSSNNSDDEDETTISYKVKGDEDEEMDYTTSQLYDDVDIRLNEPVDTDKGFVQVEDIPHTDAKIVSSMDVYVHHEVPSQQTPTLLTVPISVVSDSSPIFSTVTPQSLPSFIPPLHKSTSTPPPTTEATSTLPDFASVFQFNNRVTTLEKEVAKLKKDHFHTQVIALVDDHLDARLGATRNEFMNFLSASITARITEQKREISKDEEPTKGPKVIESQSGSSKGDKSQTKSSGKSVQSEEREFESNYAEMKYEFEECYKALSEKLDWENPKGGDYPFDLTKPLPLVMSGKHQKVPVDYFFNNDLKYLQGGVLTMTYTTSITKTKATQYDLPCIKNMIKGKVPTEMELVPEQTKQGTSYEVSVSAEGVEEFKRKVKIKGEEKEALLTLRQKLVNTSAVRITKMIANIED
uniref:Uncharacterized protein n=1 Tax=Tanacetum cinerariifolium TaxID=118510 RepID=A0A6L2KQZ8_TANCI|nr:hypothetical protein [Tanacetum cinerariifolium]